MKKYLPKPFKEFLKLQKKKYQVYGKEKIFGIGLNKTGTTSLKIAMNDLGYVVGDQRKGEALVDDWKVRDFSTIEKYCQTAQFFQDAPFSYPFTFMIIDQLFPKSKFILTIRENEEKWYDSITQFHARKWGKDSRVPTKEDLMNATYLEKGRPWRGNRALFNTPEDDPYKKEVLIEYYNRHNNDVKDYFKFKQDQLLILNIASKNSYIDLCNFIERKPLYDTFPWENKTKEIKS